MENMPYFVAFVNMYTQSLKSICKNVIVPRLKFWIFSGVLVVFFVEIMSGFLKFFLFQKRNENC